MKYTRRDFFFQIATLAGCGYLSGCVSKTLASTPKVKKNNVILIMTDDQGYGNLACHGHPFIKTPNLDKLYAQSTRFTDFHVSPTCSPTRSALMSGRAPFKNSITHTILERERMALSSTTIAEVLKTAGYTTGIFGKWHLGDGDAYQDAERSWWTTADSTSEQDGCRRRQITAPDPRRSAVRNKEYV